MPTLINILFVDTSPTPTRGGAQKSLLSILSLLDRTQYSPFVLMHVPHGIEAELEKLGVPYFIHNSCIIEKKNKPASAITIEPNDYHGTWRDFAYRVKSLLTIERKRFQHAISIMKQTNAHLVYLNGNYTAAHGALLAAKWMGTPVIAHQRRLSVYTILDRYAAKWIDRMIMYSQNYSDYLEELKVHPKTKTVIYNGINRNILHIVNEEMTLNYRKEFNLLDDIPVLCQIGTVHPVKGQEIIIKSVRKIWDSSKPFYLLFVGDLRDTVYVQNIKEEMKNTDVEKYVRFVGERNDAISILSLSDISLEATQAEAGFSRVVIESLCMGKMVVAPKAGCSEIIQDQRNGFLYTDGDIEDCANAIQDALNQVENNVTHNINESYLNQFSDATMIQKIEQNIRDVLS